MLSFLEGQITLKNIVRDRTLFETRLYDHRLGGPSMPVPPKWGTGTEGSLSPDDIWWHSWLNNHVWDDAN